MRKAYLFLVLLLLCSCATLSPVFEDPQIKLSSIRMLPSNGVLPEFEIGLHVINPNRLPLKLFGLSYELALEGHQVLTGVASDLPVIEGYSEGDVLLRATPDLFSTIGLFTELVNQPREQFNYSFSARLDVGKFLPKISVEKSGLISFPVKKR